MSTPAAPRRRCGEALVIEHFNATNDDGTVYGVPTAATDGIEVPQAPQFDQVAVELLKSAASGTRTLQVTVYGYRRFRQYYSAGVLTERPSSGYWVPIYTSNAASDSGDYNESHLLRGCHQFARLAIQILANGGTTPALTGAFAFGHERRA